MSGCIENLVAPPLFFPFASSFSSQRGSKWSFRYDQTLKVYIHIYTNICQSTRSEGLFCGALPRRTHFFGQAPLRKNVRNRRCGAMDEVIGRVKGHRDVLFCECSESQISEALEALNALGSLPEQVLGETFVGLAVDKICKDSTMPEHLKNSGRELLQFWKDNLQKWRSTPSMPSTTTDSMSVRERSPRDMTSHMDVAAVPHLTKQREKVVDKLAEALSTAVANMAPSLALSSPSVSSKSSKPPLLLAAEIEATLHTQLEGRKYVAQARSLLYNIKDASNVEFRQSLLEGNFDLRQLPTLTAEAMASSSRNATRAQVRKEAFEAAAAKPASHTITDKFVCEKCSSNRTAYTQSAAVESCVRSGGEPVETTVTFVTCLACSYAWTERSGFA